MSACDRPGCDLPARHAPTHGETTFTGWEHVCCLHADVTMIAAASSCTSALDAVLGWESWVAAHTESCGARSVASALDAAAALHMGVS